MYFKKQAFSKKSIGPRKCNGWLYEKSFIYKRNAIKS